MVINHNISANYSNRVVGINEVNLQKNMEKLSSGERINRAADDAAGLSISEKMRSQIRGLNQASKNISNGTSFIQTAEGYMQETSDILQRVRELSVQSANGIYSSEDRAMMQVEVSQLVSEVNRIASVAQFNGMGFLKGEFSETGMNFAVGANTDQYVEVKIGDMSASALGLEGDNGSLTIATMEDANVAINTIDEALTKVNSQRAELGAYQNRFEMAKQGIDVAAENLTNADAVLRDTEMSSEMVDYVKNNILTQASTSMLAQANNNSSNVLNLLR